MSEELKTPELASEEQLALEPIKQVPGMQTMWNNPKLMNQSFRMANMISKSGLVPDSYKNSPENCLIAIDLGNRMGMSPMAVMQNLYIVKGKPAWDDIHVQLYGDSLTSEMGTAISALSERITALEQAVYGGVAQC